MILRYRLLAERLRVELQALERIVTRAENAVFLARQRPAEQDYFLGSAALVCTRSTPGSSGCSN